MPAKFLEDDIDHMLDAKEFGADEGTVIWQGVTIGGVIVDDMDVEVEVGEGVGEIVQQPMLTGKTSDFPGIAAGDSIQIGIETLRVKNFMRDGTGVIEIYLDRLS